MKSTRTFRTYQLVPREEGLSRRQSIRNQDIAQRRAKGQSAKAIAKHYQISETRVNQIVGSTPTLDLSTLYAGEEIRKSSKNIAMTLSRAQRLIAELAASMEALQTERRRFASLVTGEPEPSERTDDASPQDRQSRATGTE